MWPFIIWTFIGYVVLIVIVIAAMRHSRDPVLGIPANLPNVVEQKYQLRYVEKLKSLCPPGFLERSRSAENLTGLQVAGILALVAIAIFAKFQLRKTRIPGWNLDDVFPWVLCAVVVVSFAYEVRNFVVQSSKSYSIRLDLGDDPLTRKSSRFIPLLGFAILFLVLSYDWFDGVREFDGNFIVTNVLFILIFIGAALTSIFQSRRIVLTEDGILLGRGIRCWDGIAWYRWYDHREGVLVGLEPSPSRQVMMVLPVSPENEHEVADLLERFVPGKRLDDIQTATLGHPVASAFHAKS